MKPKTLALLAFLTMFFSCQKQSTTNPDPANTSSDSDTLVQIGKDTFRIASAAGGKMVQDVYVNSLDSYEELSRINLLLAGCEQSPDFSDSNVIYRSFIRFSVVDSIPENATIIEAKLFLATPPPSEFISHGNSSYPGSPDTQNNTALIRRVDSAWDETELNWPNQPRVDTTGQVKIFRSDKEWDWKSESDITELVQYQVSHKQNYGYCITPAVEKPYRMMVFQSSDTNDKSIRPKIVVYYKR